MPKLLTSFLIIIPLLAYSQKETDGISGELHDFILTTGANEYRLWKGDDLLSSWTDPQCDEPYLNTASLMKSLTGIAVGILLERGDIDSLDQPVCDLLPEWKAGCQSHVTIRHLLTMTSGMKKQALAQRAKFFNSDDLNAHVYEMGLDTIPGARWSYSNEAAQLLEPVIERASGIEAGKFFKEQLFDPLEMDSTGLMVDNAGNVCVIGGASTTVQDLANFAHMMLDRGMWKGNRIVSEDFIDQATSAIAQNRYYGYLWWVNEEQGSFTAMGDGGQIIIILPEKDLIFMRFQNCNKVGQQMAWMGELVERIGAIEIK